jgi:hypothetical protein
VKAERAAERLLVNVEKPQMAVATRYFQGDAGESRREDRTISRRRLLEIPIQHVANIPRRCDVSCLPECWRDRFLGLLRHLR